MIASIVERARLRNPPIPVMVVTGDRDAYQLVDDGIVRIMTTSRGITDTRVYDREGVIERYGIPPELVPDFIGLKGDTSDNIPGVPGIGDKTAAELLQRFGSLEGVLEHIDEISGAKRKQNLTEHAEDARMSKQLATAKRDIPIELDLQSFVATEPDRSKLRDVFRQYELREPLRRLEEALGSADAAAPAPAPRARRSARGCSERDARGRRAAAADGAVARGPTARGSRGPAVRRRTRATASVPSRAGRARAGPRGIVRAARGPRRGDRRATRRRPRRQVARRGARRSLAHDTEVAAYLLEPARRAYPFRELCEERGFAADVEDRRRRGRTARARARRVAARGDPRTRA